MPLENMRGDDLSRSLCMALTNEEITSHVNLLAFNHKDANHFTCHLSSMVHLDDSLLDLSVNLSNE